MNVLYTDKRGVLLRAILVVFLLAACLILSGCEEIKPNEKQTTIYIATDIHLFSDNLVGENNKVYVKEKFVSDGRIQEYDYELVRALVDTVNSEKPEFLVLTGDLSFNGERDSHAELVRLLSEVGEHTKVLVIPGNHDTYSLEAVSVINDEIKRIESIDGEEFKKLYSDFGYTGGYSYDENSLSYIYELSEDKWALMLDTTQSKYNAEYSSNLVGGCIEDGTMAWLEENLAYAKENGISVISFTHHNLLVHNELFKSSYTLYNSEDVVDLFTRYGVTLNFSGHLHIQSIKSEEKNDSTVYDISGVSLLDYGNRYGRLEIYDNCYSYESRTLDLSKYGEGLSDYSFKVFCDKYYYKTLWRYQMKMGAEKGGEATRLLSRINAYYFDGSYEEICDLVKKNRRLIRLIKKNTESYDGSYVQSIIEVPNEDQHSLLIER